MKILVEDEPKTGDYLQQGLAESGFVVDLARNGVDGLHLAVTGDHDLLVLDVMLPGLNGWQVLETLRRSGKEIPVLLTARDQVRIVSGAWSWGLTTTWSSRSRSRSSWRVCAPCCAGAEAAWNPPRCAPPTWNWICCAAAWYAVGSAST
jgi:CheY-like chemotaxis protein